MLKSLFLSENAQRTKNNFWFHSCYLLGNRSAWQTIKERGREIRARECVRVTRGGYKENAIVFSVFLRLDSKRKNRDGSADLIKCQSSI